jgi:hypothetical protein
VRNVALLQLAAAPEAAFLGGRGHSVFVLCSLVLYSLLTRMKTSRIKDYPPNSRARGVESGHHHHQRMNACDI